MSAFAIGLMSGTSCDGISAALVKIDKQLLEATHTTNSIVRTTIGDRERPVYHHVRRRHALPIHVVAELTIPYPHRLAERLRQSSTLRTAEISSLHMELGERFARTVQQLLQRAHIPPNRVDVIGSHGHTIYHGPRDATPSTFQIGEAATISHRTGIPVVSNFRPRDIVAGGEGAPLVPYFDEVVFGDGPVRALQNIGGIANVTVVGQGVHPQAFDTGPGNCLIDLVVSQMSHGRLHYDAEGRLARRGRILLQPLKRLWSHAYFRQPPPKSTGRELFNEMLLRQVFGVELTRSPYDVLATVTYFTAYSIAHSLRRFTPRPLEEMIVSGGGVYNRTLTHHLEMLLSPIPVRSIEAYGIPAQAKECAAFALLALRAAHGRINHLPATTGARTACILGQWTPATPGRTTQVDGPRRAHNSSRQLHLLRRTTTRRTPRTEARFLRRNGETHRVTERNNLRMARARRYGSIELDARKSHRKRGE